jgi:hypothetical protein
MGISAAQRLSGHLVPFVTPCVLRCFGHGVAHVTAMARSLGWRRLRWVEDTPENHSQTDCGVERARLVISPTIPRLAWPAILAWI